MSRFYTADTHFHHDLMAERRGFQNVQVHDEAIIDGINARVQKTDELYILGDVIWSGNDLAKLRNRITCRHIKVVLGNHDKRGQLVTVFGEAPDTRQLKIDEGNTIWLSHYPHAYWPRSHYGSYHLYGHMHDQREETLDSLFPNRRSMDVGIESAMRILGQVGPFSEGQILNCLNKKGHDPLAFYIGPDAE